MKIWTDDVDPGAMEQLINMSKLPEGIVHQWIAVMPDVHWGMGATIGSVIPTIDAIVPAAVGVDIGCGMMAVETNLSSQDLPDSMREIRHSIERDIPLAQAVRIEKFPWINSPGSMKN